MAMSPVLTSFHVSMGGLGLLSGAVALFSKKGCRLHRTAGNVFFVSMLIMAALGAYGALLKPEMISVLNGVLTCYLVATSWVTIRRKEGTTGPFDAFALLVALATGIAHLRFGLEAANNANGLKEGFPAMAFYIFGSVALVAAALDARMLLAGGVFGAQRIARHLWRMCFALFIATASLFLGQQQVFPESLRGTLALAAPVIIVILTSVYWLIRVLSSGRYRAATPSTKNVRSAAP